MIHFNPDVHITRENPHCIGWVRAMASLWGHVRSHGLDEPVRLTEEIPVRLRYSHMGQIISDRALEMKTLQAGTHVALRFYFSKSSAFLEFEIPGINTINRSDLLATVSLPC